MNTQTVRVGPVRRGLRATFTGAAVVAALLAATACDPSDGDSAAAAPSKSASSAAKPSKSAEPSGDSSTGSGQDGGPTGSGTGSGTPDCRSIDLTTDVELQDAAGETPRHFLLTVTNGLRTRCALNDAPILRLGAGNTADIVETLGEPDSEPVIVEGGGKAYAGLYIFGNDEGGEAEYDQSDRFTATLVAHDGTEWGGTLIFDLPGKLKSVSYDKAARVNGWAGTEGLAMRPITML
ncbi:DUF4232 domain-containing protein [Streptomyces sp. NBC_01465]|uniref:DUF4232 domain-containing protein n=1 Tax=Streptomyces sp. NBC_01465 TaxID=2903878 RepID=UPI002E37A96C|nr:DUF4232 domain-containing protein [Streptomyces sp. NBC_01465]